MTTAVSRETQHVWIVQDFSTQIIFAVWSSQARADQYVAAFPTTTRDCLRVKKMPIVH